MKSRWTEKFKVKWFETDASGKLSITSICNFLQETAWNHASKLGLGYSDLSENNTAWVLISYQIEILKYPELREEIIVETWPSGIERLFANRELVIKDTEGNTLINASTKWLIIDLKTRRPQKPDILKDILHLANPEKATNFGSFKFPPKDSLVETDPYTVRYSDIDLYGHVNNSRYIQWVIDSIPLQFLQDNSIRNFEIKFAHECKYGEEITFLSNPDEYSLIAGIRRSDNKDIFQVKIGWEGEEKGKRQK